MREYGKVAPTYWTGATGRMLRAMGRDEQLLGLFLLTNPNARMIGLYHLPLAMIVHYLGWTEEGASEGLRRVSEANFAHYDAGAEEVWVPEMAAYQIGEPLDLKDKRVCGVIREWELWCKSRYYMDFYKRYRESFHLPVPRPQVSPLQAPCKPLRSQEQEQEQEQEEQTSGVPDVSPEAAKPPSGAEAPLLTFETVGAVKSWALTPVQVAEWSVAFPALDVLAECRKALAWTHAAPRRRKTAAGMARFLFGWLGRAQDRGGAAANGPPQSETLRERIARVNAEMEARNGES